MFRALVRDMVGPEQPGTWAPHADPEHQFLKAGQRYRVARQFVDFDKTVHPVGEQWTFLGCNFVPYHDGMSFFVSLDGTREWHIRLQWIPEQQAEILDNLATYLEPVQSKRGIDDSNNL